VGFGSALKLGTWQLGFDAPRSSKITPTMWFNRETPPLGDFEQLTMLAVLRLDEDAYGAAIQREIEVQTGRVVSVNAIYTTLDRLEAKGLLRSWIGAPTQERGGRRKKHYGLEPLGLAAISQAYRTMRRMSRGFERLLERS
jgi:PadR family transcriptional regulator PadR